MSVSSKQVFVAASVAMWCLAVTPGWSQALNSVVAYGAQDVYLNHIPLDDARRAALIAFVQGYEMPSETRAVVLNELRQPEVAIGVVQRFEEAMAAQ